MIHITMGTFIIVCVACTAMSISIGTILSIFVRSYKIKK